jgi:hypothetical protein
MRFRTIRHIAIVHRRQIAIATAEKACDGHRVVVVCVFARFSAALLLGACPSPPRPTLREQATAPLEGRVRQPGGRASSAWASSALAADATADVAADAGASSPGAGHAAATDAEPDTPLDTAADGTSALVHLDHDPAAEMRVMVGAADPHGQRRRLERDTMSAVRWFGDRPRGDRSRKPVERKNVPTRA